MYTYIVVLFAEQAPNLRLHALLLFGHCVNLLLQRLLNPNCIVFVFVKDLILIVPGRQKLLLLQFQGLFCLLKVNLALLKLVSEYPSLVLRLPRLIGRVYYLPSQLAQLSSRLLQLLVSILQVTLELCIFRLELLLHPLNVFFLQAPIT